MAFDYFSKARMQYILTKIKGLFGQANCIASLDENAKLDSSQIPTNVIKTSSISGLVKNDGSIDTNSYATTSQIPDISGKVNKSGDTMTGNLTIQRNDDVSSFSLRSPEKENVGRAIGSIYKNASSTSDNGTLITDYTWGETTKRTALNIRDNATLTDKLILQTKDSEGTTNTYKIFGEHNSSQYTQTEKEKLAGISANANKVEASTTNGNIKIDGTETQVYDETVGNLSGSHSGTCETAAATSAKIVTIGDGTWIPKEGDIIAVKFTYSNTALFVTLNVNGIGNKGIWYGDSVDPSGADYICGKAGSYIFYMYDGTYWIWLNEGKHDGNNYPSVAVYTDSNQQVKIGTCNYYTLTNKSYCHFIFRYPNFYKGELLIKINNSSSKTIYINGEISSSTNYTLPAGTYIAYYENDKWYFRTDGKLTANITGTAASDSTKADKVANATNGNLAGLNGSGNLTDSGVAANSIGNLSSIKMGVCDTAANVKDKVVTIGDGTSWQPKAGDMVGVKFTNANTYSSSTTNPITLSVNGVKANIWYNNTHSGAGNTGTAASIYGRTDVYIYYVYNGTYWVWINEGRQDGNNYPSVAVYGNAADSIKSGSCNYYVLTNKSYCHFIFRYSNTYNGKLQMNVNNTGAKDIYINGEISSSSNNTLPAGTYIAYYENNIWYFRTDGLLPATTTADKDIQDKIDPTTTSISGNPISITGLKSNQLAVNPVITFEPIQAGSGDPSPSNVRAISGYDKIEVLSCGKNICDVSKAKSIDVISGTMRNGLIIFLHSGYYTISRTTGDNLYYGIKNRNEDSFATTGSVALNSNVVINALDNQLLYLWVDNNSYISRINNLQVEEGQTATTYEPCNKTTDLSENLPQTVYGGTLDVRTGVLTVNKAIYVYNGSETWAIYGGGYYCTSFTLPKPQQISNSITNSFVYQYSYNNGKYKYVEISGRYSPHFSYSGVSDVNGWKTYLQSNNIQFVYPLETPIEIQLTLHEISLLKDYAYASTNGTSISLDYHNGEIATLGDVAESELYTMSWVKKLMTRLSSVHLYAFHIDGATGEVTYLEDNANYTPAYMDYTKGSFNYASWQDAFFMPKPCVLGMDGHVKCYLDPYNYAKDIDGNTVAIDSTLTDGNVMIEFPKIWSKVVPDAGDPASATVYICNQQIDDEFKDYAYIDSAGTHKEHMYTPAYNGSYDSNNKMRSISGAQVGKTLSGTTEIERAEANGAGWYTEDAGEVMLINFLLILMGKSVDTQTVFGQGLHTGGSEAINDGFRTGIHNTKGLFYGTNSGTIASGSYGNAVKVFGMENWWGFQWRRYAGDMLVDGVIKVKMCKGRNDGTTVSGYNTDATGYINTGVTPSGTNGGYITLMNFNKYGMFSSVSASSSTTYKDGQWYNTGTRYAIRGGTSANGAPVGAFCVHRYHLVSSAAWNIGAALSFK